MNRTTRRWLQKLHLWAGLALTLPLIMVAVTGALLVYANQLAPVLDGDAWRAEKNTDPLSWAELVSELENWRQDTRIAHVGGDRHGDGPLMAYVVSPSDGFTPALIDPYTGRITERTPKREWVKTIEAFHRNLLAGSIGRQIVAVSSIALIPLVVIGIVLWWPLRRGTLTRLKGRGALLHWHNLVGVIAMPALIAFALTGVTLTYHKTIIPALYGLATGQGEPEAPAIEQTGDPATVPRILEAARDALPGHVIQSVSEPSETGKPYKLRMRDPEGIHPIGWHFVHVHPGTAEVVQVRNMATESWASWYDNSWYVIHTGSFLPPLPRILWLFLALSLPVLGVTGFWRWWRRRRPTTQRR